MEKTAETAPRHASNSGIVMAALVLGFCLIIGFNKLKPNNNTVTVRGLCEIEVMADRVIYPVSYKEASNDLNALYETVNRKNAILRNFLKEHGIADSCISIVAPKVVDKLANDYGNMIPTYRYVMTSVVNVCTQNVQAVLDIMANQSQLMEKGILVGGGNEWETPTIFSFEGLNSIKPQMIEEANKNARAAGEQFAKDSGSKLGKIQSATQGLFSIESRDANTPYLKRVRVVTNVTYYLK